MTRPTYEVSTTAIETILNMEKSEEWAKAYAELQVTHVVGMVYLGFDPSPVADESDEVRSRNETFASDRAARIASHLGRALTPGNHSGSIAGPYINEDGTNPAPYTVALWIQREAKQ